VKEGRHQLCEGQVREGMKLS